MFGPISPDWTENPLNFAFEVQPGFYTDCYECRMVELVYDLYVQSTVQYFKLPNASFHHVYFDLEWTRPVGAICYDLDSYYAYTHMYINREWRSSLRNVYAASSANDKNGGHAMISSEQYIVNNSTPITEWEDVRLRLSRTPWSVSCSVSAPHRDANVRGESPTQWTSIFKKREVTAPAPTWVISGTSIQHTMLSIISMKWINSIFEWPKW